MELQKALEQRRSIRQFKNQKIEPEKLQQIIQAATLAPSWKNSQVTRYYVVSSEDYLKKVKNTLSEFNQKNVQDAPVLIVSTIVLNRSGFERDGSACNELGNGWGYYDCGMHNMNLLLKATELGLGTLVMGMRDADEIRRILEIPETEGVVSVIGVGYSDLQPEMPKRKCVEDIAKFF